MTPEQFNRKLRNLEAMLYRQDKRLGTGRNSNSTDATMSMHFNALRNALRSELHDDSSPLYAALEANPKLAARWNRMERRMVGLPT